MNLISCLSVAVCKFVVRVMIPATFLFVKGLVDTMFPSSAREILEDI